MRYKWDGFLGHDVDTYLGQDVPTTYSLAPEPEAPSGAFAPDATQSVVITNTFPSADVMPPIAIPDLRTPAWPPPSSWPVVPEAPNPSIAETQRVSLPAPTPSPSGPYNQGFFADIATGISKIFTPIVSTALPLLERYGAIRPVVGPARLPLPGESRALWASQVYGRAALPSLQGATPWLIGGGLVAAVILMARGGVSGGGGGRRRRR